MRGPCMMRNSIGLLVATVMGVAAFVPAAHAQDMTTATVGGTTIWVGGGVQFLSLPDIRFTEQNGRKQKNSESDWLDFGGAAGGGIETSLGMWGNSRVTGSVKGFFANIETDDRKNCNGACVVFDPATGLGTRQRNSQHQDRPRGRLLGRPSRVEIRARRAGARETQSLP